MTFARVAKKSQILPEIALRDDRVPHSRQRARTQNPRRRKFGVDAWNAMVQKKIVAISFEEGVVFRAQVFARTLLYVFLVTSTFFRWIFSNYVEDYSIYTYT